MSYVLVVIAGIAIGWTVKETQRRRSERDLTR